MFIISQPPSVAKTSDGSEKAEGSYSSLPLLFFQQDGGNVQGMRWKKRCHGRIKFLATDSDGQILLKGIDGQTQGFSISYSWTLLEKSNIIDFLHQIHLTETEVIVWGKLYCNIRHPRIKIRRQERHIMQEKNSPLNCNTVSVSLRIMI